MQNKKITMERNDNQMKREIKKKDKWVTYKLRKSKNVMR